MSDDIAASVTATIGVGFMLWGLWLMFRGLGSGSWPSTAGVILESSVVDYHESGDLGYGFQVKYQYLARGEVITDTRVQFGLRREISQEAAHDLLARYPVGAEVTVFHHPRKALAALETGFTSATYFLLLVGGFVLIVAYCKV